MSKHKYINPMTNIGNLTVIYTMNKRELELFNQVILSPNERFRYSAFILVLMNECNYDMLKVLRVLNASTRQPRLIHFNISHNVIRFIKTSIVLAEHEKGLTISEMSKLNRFIELDIKKDFIYRVRKKHSDIWYRLSKQKKRL